VRHARAAANEFSSKLRQCGRVAGALRKFGGHSPSPQRIAGEGLFFSHVSVRIAVQRTIIILIRSGHLKRRRNGVPCASEPVIAAGGQQAGSAAHNRERPCHG